MGRKSKRSNTASVPAYNKQVERIFRQLGVPHHSSVDAEAERRLGAPWIRKWDPADIETKMAMALESLDAAVVMGIGMREDLLRQQIPWICRQLDGPQPGGGGLVVDVGSGTGITAVCVNRLQGHPVLAIDAEPASVEICSQIAAKLGASVDARCLTLAALDATEYQDRIKAVVAQALVLYTWGAHHHEPGHSWEESVRRRLRDPEGRDSEFARLFDVAPGARLLLVDFTCPEVSASIVALAAQRGLRLDLAGVEIFSGQVGEGRHTQVGFPFLPEDQPVEVPAAADLLDAIAPGTSRHEGQAQILTAWAAERAARSLPPSEAAWSLTGQNAEQRVAIGVDGATCYVYRSTSTGDRQLWTYPAATWAGIRDGVHDEVAAGRRIGDWYRSSGIGGAWRSRT